MCIITDANHFLRHAVCVLVLVLQDGRWMYLRGRSGTDTAISLSAVFLEEYEQQVFLSTSPSAAESLCQAEPSAGRSDL